MSNERKVTENFVKIDQMVNEIFIKMQNSAPPSGKYAIIC